MKSCRIPLVAGATAGALIHFTVKCRCWKCQECRADHIARHSEKARQRFPARTYYVVVPNDGFDAAYARFRREKDEDGKRKVKPQYMRIIVAGESHLFLSRKVNGSTEYGGNSAAQLAAKTLAKIDSGGHHVTYSRGWTESLGESIRRYTLKAVGIPRKAFEAIAENVKLTLRYFNGLVFAPKCEVEPDELVTRMKARRHLSNAFGLSYLTNSDAAYLCGVDLQLTGSG